MKRSGVVLLLSWLLTVPLVSCASSLQNSASNGRLLRGRARTPATEAVSPDPMRRLDEEEEDTKGESVEKDQSLNDEGLGGDDKHKDKSEKSGHHDGDKKKGDKKKEDKHKNDKKKDEKKEGDKKKGDKKKEHPGDGDKKKDHGDGDKKEHHGDNKNDEKHKEHHGDGDKDSHEKDSTPAPEPDKATPEPTENIYDSAKEGGDEGDDKGGDDDDDNEDKAGDVNDEGGGDDEGGDESSSSSDGDEKDGDESSSSSGGDASSSSDGGSSSTSEDEGSSSSEDEDGMSATTATKKGDVGGDSELPADRLPPGEQHEEETHTVVEIPDEIPELPNEQLKEELHKEQKQARVFGGFGFLFAIIAMVFTAHQMSENPDGIFASLCRLAMTIIGCIIKVILMPCRSMLGHRYHGLGTVNTMDYREPYRSHQMELT